VVAERVALPPGTRLGWAGQFEYWERAKQRLWIVLPITLALVMLLLYLTLAHRAREASGRLRNASDLEEAIVEGAARRIRPKLMTVVTMILGLTPLLWSQGTGADVMKRIAAPMVGGLVTSFLLELLVYPALFAAWKSRALRAGRG